MRIKLHIIASLLLTVAAAQTGYAQMAKVGCMDQGIRVQGEQIKHDFKAQGMEIYKDAMLTMSSKDPYPIAVQLTQGTLYQFVFVGNKDASKLYFELFDGADTKLVDKVVENKGSNNFMIYSFIPQKTDLYLLIVSQKVKGNREVCGSFTVMQKANGGNTQ
ncbi:MAG: hypothetical protein H6550_08650 [Chitinophagales bacterium]|nr:hypothetical protein [Chitinophagales bacterium]